MSSARLRATSGAVLAGWHELAVTKTKERPSRVLLAEAVQGAIRHSGFDPSEVDGFAVGGFTLGPDHAVDLAARCGLGVTWLAPQDPGGPSGINALLQAASAVRAGDASVVVCAAADNTDAASLAALNASFSTSFAEGLAPIGAAAATVVFAFLQEQHQARYGSSRRDFGQIAVAQRRNAANNPRALFRKPLSIEDYLTALPVAEPIHLFDCVYPGSGAAAVVVTTADRLRGRGRQSVAIDGGFLSHGQAQPEELDFGWAAYAPALFELAGRGPGEFSTVELYDDFPFMVAVQLEELGFFRRGELSQFLAANTFAPDSSLPLNTGGGMLNCGQGGGAGGYLPLVQAARQLAGQAGATQVSGANSALITGLGMIDQNGPQSVGAAVLSVPPGGLR